MQLRKTQTNLVITRLQNSYVSQILTQSSEGLILINMRVVIVGNGPASASAVEAFRKVDKT
ncbi:MAG: hypothetical protein NZ526_07830, partial [Aquificaceae bacterium]|nr:hypothetical protein [Aquificaceae bacterium]